MTIDPVFLAIGIPAAILAGISKGGFGSGAAFVAALMLLMILPPDRAIGLFLPLLILIDAASVRPYWRRWNWPEARRLILAGLPGTLAGAALWSVASPELLKALIGAVAVGFVLWQAAVARGWASVGRDGVADWLAWPLGAAAGFTSFIAHAGGPWTAVYLLSRRPGKTEYQATTVLIFGALNLAKLPFYVGLGMVDGAALRDGALLAPAALLGVWIGVALHRAISPRAFFLLTYALLLVTGVKLLWDAAGAL